MKCQSLFSGKNKKNTSKCHLPFFCFFSRHAKRLTILYFYCLMDSEGSENIIYTTVKKYSAHFDPGLHYPLIE